MRWKRVARYVLAGLTVSVLALILWGVMIEPRLIDIERETVQLRGLDPRWHGQRIALLADLQVGMWMANTGTARRVIDRLVEDPPAAVLIAGDFLYKADDAMHGRIEEAVAIVRPLPEAGIPTFAVLGNHDYSLDLKDDSKNSDMAEQLREALERAGIRVLRNEAVPLSLANDATARNDSVTRGMPVLYVAGIGSHWADEDDPETAIGAVPDGAPYLVFMHNPRSFETIPAGRAPVAFAAHTHGGQVRVPFTPDWSWLTFVKDDPVHADGWSDGGLGQPGNRLYVNRGIGFSDVPLRINCPPELTIFTLAGFPRSER